MSTSTASTSLVPETIISTSLEEMISILDAFITPSANDRRKEISLQDILPLVKQARDIALPCISANSLVRDWMEANCSDHIAALADLKSSRSSQKAYIYVRVKGYSKDRSERKKKSCARCLLAAALYSSRHENEEGLEILKSMLKPVPETTRSNGKFEVNKESEEFIRRKHAVADQEMPSIMIHRDHNGDHRHGDSTAAEPISWSAIYAKNQSLQNQLQFTLENLGALNLEYQHDIESRTAITAPLVGVKDALRPTRVVVVGGMSDGKSTFISNVLSLPGFLKSGNGSTTSVPTEMAFASTIGFRATIYFVSQVEHNQDVEYFRSLQLNEGNIDESQDEDAKYEMMKSKLSLLYNYRYTEDLEMVIDFQSPRCPLALNIGREPLVLEADSMAALGQVVQNEPELQQIVNNGELADNPTITLVRLEGPFQHIPPGVVLIDTPGLGDADHLKSYKTLELLHTADVVWFVRPVAYQLGGDWDAKTLAKVKQLGKLVREWHVVASKADTEADRTDDQLRSYRNNMARIYFEDFIKGETRRNDVSPSLFHHMKMKYPNEYKELEDEVDKVSIHFFTNRVEFCEEDCNTWRNILVHYCQQHNECLAKQLELINHLTLKFEQDGWANMSGGTLRSMKGKFEKALNELKKAIDNCLGDRAKLETMITGIIHQWNDYKAQSRTRRAIMKQLRRGEFTGKKMNTRVRYDLNEVMATQWMSKIQRAWNLFLGEVHSIQGSLCSISGSGVLASNLHDQILRLGRKVFEVDVKSILRGLLTENGVYDGRNLFPTNDELFVVFHDQFRFEIDAVVGSARQKGSFQQTMDITSDNISSRSVPVHRCISTIMRALRAEVQNIASMEVATASASAASTSAVPSLSEGITQHSNNVGGGGREREESDAEGLPHGKKARTDDKR